MKSMVRSSTVTGVCHHTHNDPEGCPNEMKAKRGNGLEEQHSQERQEQRLRLQSRAGVRLSVQGKGDEEPLGVSDLSFTAPSGCWVESTSQKNERVKRPQQ